MINRDSFEQWEEVTNPSPMAARQMYMLLLSAKDEVADDVLKLAAKRRLSAKMLLPYLKSKDLDTSQLEAAIEAESGGAEAPLPKPRTQTSSFFDRHPAGGQQAVPTRTFTPVEEPKRAQKEPSFLEKMKAKLAKQKDDQARSDSNGGDGNSKKKVILWIISIVAVLILLGALGFWLFQTSGSQSPFSSGASYSSQQTEAPTQTLPQSTETPPQLTNPNPLDFVSNTWLKALQLLLTVEIIGIIVVLFGDAKVRKQLLDAVVTMLMTVLTVFVVLPADTAWWIAGLLLLFEVGVVLYASISGGRDFTPTGAYFLCVGTIGGLLANKIEAFQAVFHITSAPVLPIVQLGVLFQLMDWSHLAFPVMVYITVFIGVGVTLFEGLRPSEDRNPRWGTIIGATIGLILYFGILHGLHLAAWAAFLVAYSLSIGVSALSQSERAIPLVTNKWGVRSIFDGAMLFTAILLVFQIFTGLVG